MFLLRLNTTKYIFNGVLLYKIQYLFPFFQVQVLRFSNALLQVRLFLFIVFLHLITY